MKLIAQGAEAKIRSDGKRIQKERFGKSYRIPEIDERLRRFRTRREAKVIERLGPLGFGPKLISSDDGKMEIVMENVRGKKVRDTLDKDPSIGKTIGENLARMHDEGIIHGDLTTSNMIVLRKRVTFIDFGLSFFSDKLEDKAVDIHLFRQALESAHHKVEKKAYQEFLKGYRRSKSYQDTLARLEVVERRGRHKQKH